MRKPAQLSTLRLNLGYKRFGATISRASMMLLFCLVEVISCGAQSYDPAADFEQGFINQTNPNGVWSYGWSTSFTTPITLYDETAQPGINGPNAQYWISSTINVGESPSAEYNDGPAYDDGNIDFLANEFLLVSGIEGDYSNLVFTVPTSGTYSITGSWRGCQYGIGVVVGIVVNGTVIFNSTVSQEGQIVPFGTVQNLTAGQTVIFSVGPNGGLQNTGLALNITKQAGSFTKLHDFMGDRDGGSPTAGLTMDRSGNLYGTALNGGNGYGTVYQLKHRGSGWVFNPLYGFVGGNDGAGPGFNGGQLLLASDGTLYGTTNGGGGSSCQGAGAPYPGCGTVFHLRPTPTPCTTALCSWMETVLYRFSGGLNDGFNPEGTLTVDPQTGNIYGTTIYGGSNDYGTLYGLSQSGNNWMENVLYNFGTGHYPISDVILNNGSFYGTTYMGGSDNVGTAFQLAPSNGGLTENTLYSFQDANDGGLPVGAGLILDDSGNLYGATSNAGGTGGGTIFELSPGSGGTWTLNILYSFSGTQQNGNGCGVWGSIVMNAGNLYGTTKCEGAFGYGNVFELSPSSGGVWTYLDLHDFTGGSDGGNPVSNVIFDTTGNLYGTASTGGSQGVGVVWEITP